MSRSARTLVVLPVAALAAALLGPTAAVAATPSTAPRPIPALQSTPGTDLVTRLIVRTTSGAPVGPILGAAVADAADVEDAGTVRRLTGGSSLVALSEPVTTENAWAAARELETRSDVVSAEPDIRLHPADASPVTPNDPDFDQQWDLWDTSRPGGGYSARVPAAWDRGVTGSGQVVAVIDTGITSHPDLDANVIAGHDFVGADDQLGTVFLTANDGNGRDGDPTDPGDWISAAEDSGIEDGGFFTGCAGSASSLDSSWHGTHVAGTVAAVKDNATGVAGVAPAAKVLAVRALGKCGGYLFDIADAIAWSAGQAVDGVPANANPASVINLSLGGTGFCPVTLQGAINAATTRGATVVVAAGNSSRSITATSETTGSTPANCSGVVTVTAAGRSGAKASYSNFGTVAGSVALAAPGGDATDPILSTINLGATTQSAAGYGGYQGTSMATPHVAAAVALIQSVLATPLTPTQVRARLQATAQPFPAGSGCTTTSCGAGILDVGAALPTVPSPPSVTVAPGSAALTVFPTSTGDGGAPLTGWRFFAAVQGEPLTEITPALPASTASYRFEEISGVPLLDGTTYEVSVVATNERGESDPTVVTGTPAAENAPLPVSTPYAMAPGVERFTIGWTPATVEAGSPAVTGYAIRYRKVGSATWLTTTALPTETSEVVTTWPTAMAAGVWEAQVAAVNAVGAAPFLDVPVGKANVVALAQSARLSAGAVLYPFRDGYLDAITIATSSNLAVPGVVRILNSSGGNVRQWTLPAATSGAVVWNGTNASGTRVPAGTYRAQVFLVGRNEAQAQVALLPISVRASRAATPSVSLSSATVYPVKDRFRDTVAITTRAGVPSTFTWQIIKNGRVLWAKSFTRRLAATWSWAGVNRSGVRLPDGSYTLKVTARGGEGTATVRSRPVAVSSKRVVAVPFSLRPVASSVARFGAGIPTDPYAVDDYVFFPADSIVTFSRSLPTTVKGYSSLRVTACGRRIGTPTPTPVLGYYTGTASDPTFAPVNRYLPNGSGCATTSVGPPTAATKGAVLRWYVANLRTATSTWRLETVRITGTRYALTL